MSDKPYRHVDEIERLRAALKRIEGLAVESPGEPVDTYAIWQLARDAIAKEHGP